MTNSGELIQHPILTSLRSDSTYPCQRWSARLLSYNPYYALFRALYLRSFVRGKKLKVLGSDAIEIQEVNTVTSER